MPPVDCFQQEPFELGGFGIDPARRIISGRTGETRVEPKVMAVLCVLAERAGQVVSRGELIDAVWGVAHGGDESLSRAISQLRAALHDDPHSPDVIETIAKQGYRLILQPTGIVPVPANRGSAGSPRRVWAIAFSVGIAVPLLGLIAWLIQGFRETPPPGQVGLSPASVEAGLAIGPDAMQTRLAEALSEAGLDVRTRHWQRAATSLETRLAKTGDNLELSMGLLDRDGQTLWTQTYARRSDDVEGLVTSASLRASEIIACAQRRRALGNVPLSRRGFQLLLRICEVRRASDGREELWAAAMELAQTDPEHSGARGAIAMTAGMLSANHFYDPDLAATWRARAREQASLALSLDADNADGLWAMAASYPVFSHFEQRESGFLLAHAADRTRVMPLLDLSVLMGQVGRTGEAYDFIRKARALDPAGLAVRVKLARLNAQAGRFDVSEAILEELDVLYPERTLGDWDSMTTALFYGPPTVALEHVEAIDASFWHHMPEGALTCMREFARARLQDSTSGWRRAITACGGESLPFWRFHPARFWAFSGDVHRALTALETELETWPRTDKFFRPEFEETRRDPRFMRVAARAGLTDYWLDTGHWPDFCRTPDLPYDCEAVARERGRATVPRPVTVANDTE